MSNNNGRVFIGSLLISLLMHGAVLFLVKVEKAPAGQKEPEKNNRKPETDSAGGKTCASHRTAS
ncbi:MAG: hypothetical protein LRY51_16615 [Geovibrio sp.]|nr:hypothetical protein [Geovibrio sp.]